jgi:hypothetical protein
MCPPGGRLLPPAQYVGPLPRYSCLVPYILPASEGRAIVLYKSSCPQTGPGPLGSIPGMPRQEGNPHLGVMGANIRAWGADQAHPGQERRGA